MCPAIPSRASNEIAHGRLLASRDTEMSWGWATPAGRLRAERRARLIVEGARLGPGVRALEIGCGTGAFTERFAQTGAHITAIDISPDLLEKARGRGISPERVTFLEKRFEDADLGGPFDAVIGSSILHHLEVEESVRKGFELLRPGGRFSFAEPNLVNPQVWLERNVHYVRVLTDTSPDETAFVRWKFARLLRRVGFTDVEVQPFDWLHPRVPPLLIGAVRGIGSVLEAIPGVREFAGSLVVRARRPE